jgi:DNA-directed RNA polymerase subunit RPC12/RpoP
VWYKTALSWSSPEKGSPKMCEIVFDAWYLLFTCHNCKTKHVLLQDLSQGKSQINALYRVACRDCGFEDDYESDEIERYHHTTPTPPAVSPPSGVVNR